MKVFYCPMSQHYSGGGLLVAANSKEEAIKTFMSDETYSWLWSQDKDGNYESNDYPADKFREIKKLNYQSDSPCVILENGYAE